MKTRLIIIKSLALCIIMTASSMLTSCKKYEEGPALSFRSKKERVAGTWEVTTVIQNGMEIPAGPVSMTWEFNKNGTYIRKSTNLETGTIYQESGTWEFKDKKSCIEISVQVSGSPNFYFERWDIVKLMEKELWIEYYQANEKYEIHLKQ